MPFGNEYDGAPAVVIMDIVPNIRGLGSQRRTALWRPKKKKKRSAICLAYKHSNAEIVLAMISSSFVLPCLISLKI